MQWVTLSLRLVSTDDDDDDDGDDDADDDFGDIGLIISPHKVSTRRKDTGLFGNFPQTSDPPPFWEPLIQKIF